MNQTEQEYHAHPDQDCASKQTAFKVVGIKAIIWIQKGWEISCGYTDFVVT